MYLFREQQEPEKKNGSRKQEAQDCEKQYT